MTPPAGGPLFVVGAPRSGTTLMREVLRSVEAIYLLPDEFQVLREFLDAVDRGAADADVSAAVRDSAFGFHAVDKGLWPGDAEVAEAIVEGDAASSFQRLVLLFATQEQRTTPVFWGDKTPDNALLVRRILQIWPQARFLHVLRDPRTTVDSMQRAWGRSVIRSAMVWRDCVAAVQEQEAVDGQSAILTVHYADLVATPAAVLDRVTSWLGLPGADVDFASISTGERWGSAAGLRGISRVDDDWRSAVAPAAARRVEQICFTQMQRAGFSVELAEAPHSPSPTALRAARVRDAAAVLRAYARERGPASAATYKWRQHAARRRWSSL